MRTVFRPLPLLLIFAAWQLAVVCRPETVFPSPLRVARGMVDLIVTGTPPGHLLHVHTVFSLERVAGGFLAAVALGVPLGLAVGISQRMRSVFWPFVSFFKPIPPLAWVPLSVLWFGIGLGSASFLIFMGAFFPILISTNSGVEGIDPLHIDVARTFRAKPIQIIRKVIVPEASPSILTGLRIGTGIAWMTLVAAELVDVCPGYGLGFLIMAARDLQRYDQVVAGMIVIGLLGLLIDKLFVFCETALLSWRKSSVYSWNAVSDRASDIGLSGSGKRRPNLHRLKSSGMTVARHLITTIRRGREVRLNHRLVLFGDGERDPTNKCSALVHCMEQITAALKRFAREIQNARLS